MGLFQQLFGPDLEINTKIGRLLACGQYEQCAHYLHECLEEKPKKLKRSLNYLIGHSRIEEKGKMHRYKMVNEMYELCFKEKSKYYKEAFYLPSSFNGPASRLWGAKAAEAVYSIAEKRPIRQHIEEAASALKLLEQYQIIPQGTAEKRIEILKRARFRPHGKR